MDDAARRDVGKVLAEFAQTVAEQPSAHTILERLGNYCTELLPVHGVGVLLREGMAASVATANTEAGRIVEELEAELEEGPCTDAMRTGEQVIVPDLEQAVDQYPRFVPRALEAGVRSIHALPLTLRTEPAGSLDIIARDVLDLTAAQLATAQLLGDVTMSYLANSRAFEERTRLANQLQQALDSRVIIEQAKGIVSERHGLSVSDAFERVRRYARSNGLKLHDVAGAVVRGDLDP